MAYPLSKYKFYRHGKRTIAVSTYAGKPVRGTAVCSEDDDFDFAKGKELAAARCAVRIAQKRVDRAHGKVSEAYAALKTAQKYYDDMLDYMADAECELEDAEIELTELYTDM